MAVNKEIHAEAERCLYEQNIFVVARCKTFPNYLRILSSKSSFRAVMPAKMPTKNISMVLDFKFEELNETTESSASILEQKSILLLASDLEDFCRILALPMLADPELHLFLTSTSDSPRKLKHQPERIEWIRRPVTNIELSNTLYQRMTARLQKSLLLQLQPLAVVGNVLSVSGVVADAGQAALVLSILNARFAWSLLTRWHMLESFRFQVCP
jgi:hypothetical protein